MQSDFEHDETIVNLPTETVQSGDEEALEHLWNQFNTADDKFVMYVDRAIAGQAKTVHCCTTSITGNFDDLLEECRREYIPPLDQQAEFIFKVKGADGKWIKGGNKRMIVTRKNSDMETGKDKVESNVVRTISEALKEQQAQNLSLMEKMLEKPTEEKSTAINDFLSSPAMLLILPIVAPAIMEMLKPKAAAQPTSMKEMIETMVLLQGITNPPTEKEKDDSFAGMVSNLISTMGAPIAAGAMALQNKQTALPSPGPIPANPGIDAAISKENKTRQLGAPEDVPDNAKKAEEFLKSVVSLTIKGAQKNAPPEDYASVIIDQVEPEQLEEFTAFLNDQNCLAVLALFEPRCTQFNEWYVDLIECLKTIIADETGDELTNEENAPIVPGIVPETSDAAVIDESTHSNAIDATPVGPDGDADNAETNEEVSP